MNMDFNTASFYKVFLNQSDKQKLKYWGTNIKCITPIPHGQYKESPHIRQFHTADLFPRNR